MSELISLFPTPLLRVEKLLNEPAVANFIRHIKAQHKTENARSKALCHTQIVDPRKDQTFSVLDNLLQDKLVEFGTALFGEELHWTIKEVWFNVMEPGGFQSIHAHANSFISGVIYLTHPHPTSRIVFTKSLGGTNFVFNNFNPKAKVGPYNGVKWFLPHAAPGDLILFPSYLLHEVPVNHGGQRISIAFNAIPDKLDSSGYVMHFAP